MLVVAIINNYFTTQARMIHRAIRAAGLSPIIGYALLTLVFLAASTFIFYKTTYAAYVYTAAALALTIPLAAGERVRFLNHIYGHKIACILRLVEQWLCALPFVLYLAFQQEYIAIATLLLATSAASRLRYGVMRQNVVWTPFSQRLYEFAAGFRRSWWAVLMGYLLVGIGIGVHNFNLSAAALGLLYIITMGYYTEADDVYHVWNHKGTAATFLQQKIKTALLYSFATAALPALAIAVRFPNQYWVVAAVLLVATLYLILFLLGRYVCFPSKINIPYAILFATALGFPPMLLVLLPYFYNISIKRLNKILP